MRFIETRIFTAAVADCLSDEAHRLMQLAVASRPDLGKVIPGASGLRKLRWGTGRRGKRGGVRVIYYWKPATDTCYLLYVYAKGRTATVSVRQLRTLQTLLAEELE